MLYRSLISLVLFLLAGPLAAAPLVIAHRGASGYLPEHTLAAKVLAHAQGADYIEQDVVMTRDDQLVVLHDLTLQRTTDVALRFPGRARADGGYYAIDFSLEELRSLQVQEAAAPGEPAQARLPGRFRPGAARFGIHTLAEEIELVQELNRTTGRSAGLYVELKAPWFHHQEGKDLAPAVLDVLRQYGYVEHSAAVFLQSFDHAELLRLHEELLPAYGMDLRLVQLIADNSWDETYARGADGTWLPYDYNWMHTPEGLARLATVVDGIGPQYDMLVLAAATTRADVQASPLLREAQALGLAVHPYTFRAEALTLPAWAGDLEELLRIFLWQFGVDGVFTDFPDRAVRVRDAAPP